jgi:HAMP domain-containing protein
MSDRTTRLLALLALSVALIALVVAGFALKVSQDRTEEIERLRETLERAASVTSTNGGGRPSLPLDPGDDP